MLLLIYGFVLGLLAFLMEHRHIAFASVPWEQNATLVCLNWHNNTIVNAEVKNGPCSFEHNLGNCV